MTTTRELKKIYNITDPWISASTDRSEFTITHTDGTTTTHLIPLGADVEVEEAGFNIVLTGRLDG